MESKKVIVLWDGEAIEMRNILAKLRCIATELDLVLVLEDSQVTPGGALLRGRIEPLLANAIRYYEHQLGAKGRWARPLWLKQLEVKSAETQARDETRQRETKAVFASAWAERKRLHQDGSVEFRRGLFEGEKYHHDLRTNIESIKRKYN